jgi:hypothetical protein
VCWGQWRCPSSGINIACIREKETISNALEEYKNCPNLEINSSVFETPQESLSLLSEQHDHFKQKNVEFVVHECPEKGLNIISEWKNVINMA